MVEGGVGQAHAVGRRVGVDQVVGDARSSGPRPPTTGGRARAAAARLAMLAACAGSHSTWRIAAAMASGSSWSTTQPGAGAEELDGVGERGGDHRPARRHRLDEHAGRHLLARVVRQDHHVGGRGERAERRHVEVARPERHHVGHAQPLGPRHEPVPVGLTVALEHPRMRLADDEVVRVAGRGRAATAARRSPARSPCPARAAPTSASAVRGRAPGRAVAARASDAPWGIDDDLRLVDVVVVEEALARRLGHRDQRARHVRPTASSTWRWCGVGSTSTVCSTTMLGTVEPLEHLDDAVAVGSVVDAVLVLHHHDVEAR